MHLGRERHDGLWKLLTDAGFIDDGLQIHSWSHWGGALFSDRKADIERKAVSTGNPPEITGISSHAKSESKREIEKDQGTDQEMSRPKQVSAPTQSEWTRRAEEALAASRFPKELMQLGELRAAENKTGKIMLSRIVREIYEPLVEMQDDIGDEAMLHGLRCAIESGAPNKTYVKKAALNYRGCETQRAPGGLSIREILGEDDEPSFDYEGETHDD
jgi:hypothetical protein